MSTLAGGEEEEKDTPDNEKTVFDWCKEGSVSKLNELVTDDCINSKDNQVSIIKSRSVTTRVDQ